MPRIPPQARIAAAKTGRRCWHETCETSCHTRFPDHCMTPAIYPSSARPAAAGRDTAPSGDALAAMINLAGRRRFTSQRLVLYAVLASTGDAKAIPVARDALSLFRDAHHRLVRGDGELPGMFCAELRDAYFGQLAADARIRGFIDLSQRALDALEIGSPRGAALLKELIDSATPLLDVLNRLTAIHEELSRRHAAGMKRQLRAVMEEIDAIARQARMVAFNAQIVAARAGDAGREFAVVAGTLSGITGEIDVLVKQALGDAGR
jgi:hypothetical protein